MDTSGRIGENLKKKPKRIGENARKKTEGNRFLPDDIIPNILCRLSVKIASQCRLVCKGWRDLTLTQDFIDLHLRYYNSLPMIMVSKRRRNSKTMDYSLLDKWWELSAKSRNKLMTHEFRLDPADVPFRAHFSHVGLAVFEHFGPDKRGFIVANPMNPNKVVITLSRETRWSEIYGVFFHPLLKEYCSLWMIQKGFGTSSHSKWIKYKMLTLGSNPSLKTISNPFTHRVKRRCSYPLFIDKYLYWMLRPENGEYKYSGHYDIMQFDIIGEEFTVLRCPVPLDIKATFEDTHLLDIDGTLSFLLILPRKITIWRLEDHAQKLWTTANYTFRLKLYQVGGEPTPIAVVDGKLALMSDGRLIVCNLMEGTMYSHKKRYNKFVLFLSHQMSLASLTNCTSKIYIDQEGEVGSSES